MENCTQSRLYHERQVRELCAVHALNNLFQERLFEKQDLDGFCEELSPSEWINPHRSILGLGNYDVNVLIKALQTRGCDFEWFDKRKDPNSINIDDKRRHWISIRRVDSSSYYSFDSKLKEPIKIGEEEELLSHLRSQLSCKNKELFVVKRITNEILTQNNGQ